MKDFFSSNVRFENGGRFTSRGAWTHPVISVSTWEFVLMLRGTAHLFEGERVFDASRGQAFLFRPGQTHGGSAPSTESVSFFWLHFSLDEAGERLLASLPSPADVEDDAELPLLCRQILHFSLRKTYPAAMTDSLMTMILTEYAVKAEKDTEREERLLSEVSEWIRINADRPITCAAVATQFGYNEDYLSRLFRRKRGLGLKQVIENSRADLIRRLLLTTDEPLKVVAAKTGFSDDKAFLKFVRYHEGVTPTALREGFCKIHTNNR